MSTIQDEIRSMTMGQSEEEDNDDGDVQEQEQEQGQEQELESGEQEQEQEGEVAVEVASSEDEEEETLEERYARLLEAYNLQSAKLLDTDSSSGRTQVRVPVPAQEVPTPMQDKFKFNKELAQKALAELDTGALEELINEAVQYTVNQQQSLREQILLDLPSVATEVSRQQLGLMRAVESFYNENADLKPYVNVVGAVANEIVAREPQLSIYEVFQKAEQESRRRLGLKKRILETSQTNARKPAFAKVSGSRKPGTPKLSGIKSDIAAMMQAQL